MGLYCRKYPFIVIFGQIVSLKNVHFDIFYYYHCIFFPLTLPLCISLEEQGPGSDVILFEKKKYILVITGKIDLIYTLFGILT